MVPHDLLIILDIVNLADFTIALLYSCKHLMSFFIQIWNLIYRVIGIQSLQALEAVEVTTTQCHTNPDVCRVGSTTTPLTLVDFSHCCSKQQMLHTIKAYVMQHINLWCKFCDLCQIYSLWSEILATLFFNFG